MRGVEDEGVRAILLRRELLGQDVESVLAIGTREREVVVRLGAIKSNPTHHHGREEDPHDQRGDAVASGEGSETVERPAHLIARCGHQTTIKPAFVIAPPDPTMRRYSTPSAEV